MVAQDDARDVGVVVAHAGPAAERQLRADAPGVAQVAIALAARVSAAHEQDVRKREFRAELVRVSQRQRAHRLVVGIEGTLDDEILSGICMHIAFADPLAITTDQVPADLVAKEKQFAIEQAMASGKPKDIAEKMVTGKLRKYLEANALLEQPFVRDDSKKVKEILGAAKITAFARFAVGSTK